MSVPHKPTIGILAGMGPHSTGPFIDLVIGECEAQYAAKHDVDFPRMVILSIPAPFYPDRPIDHAAMELALRGGVRQLVDVDCDFIAIACNTAHIYYQQLAHLVDVSILNMVELAAAAVPADSGPIALIAARPTVDSQIYQDALRQRGLRPLPVTWQSETDLLIENVRRPAAERAAQWRAVTTRAMSEGAELLLVACADLTAIGADSVFKKPVVDATRHLAREVVAEWLRRASLTRA